MMYQKIHKLMNDGIPLLQIIYVNFKDERLLEIGDSGNLKITNLDRLIFTNLDRII